MTDLSQRFMHAFGGSWPRLFADGGCRKDRCQFRQQYWIFLSVRYNLKELRATLLQGSWTQNQWYLDAMLLPRLAWHCMQNVSKGSKNESKNTRYRNTNNFTGHYASRRTNTFHVDVFQNVSFFVKKMYISQLQFSNSFYMQISINFSKARHTLNYN